MQSMRRPAAGRAMVCMKRILTHGGRIRFMGFGFFLNLNQSRLRVWCMERRDSGRSSSWVRSRDMTSMTLFSVLQMIV